MTFERTTGYELVRSIVTHPKIYPHVSDDFSPSAEEWRAVEHPSLWYVLVRDGQEVLGLWMFEARGVSWEVHTCLLPWAWGERGKIAAREMSAWIFANTPCERIVTNVPSYNRLALRFALAAGLKRFGVNEKSYLKNGQLHDQIMLGVSKSCQRQ